MRNPNMFKTGKKNIDFSSIMETLSGEHRNDFIIIIQSEINELESPNTRTIMKNVTVQKKNNQMAQCPNQKYS